MMEAASTSERSVNFYQTTRRNNPEDSHLYTRRRENLKSKNVLLYYYSFGHKFSELFTLFCYTLCFHGLHVL
jgi:hypothetical protein